jgi:glycosyltransferase involved in cell wall biosynthesis
MPTVSVIIPSYNHEAFVQECIQSVLDQTFQDFEIIITDDGSSDRTVEIIESFDDPRIKLFKHPENKGASAASNNCIIHSSGKYVAMLSSDDAWYPEKLASQVQYLDEHPEIGVVFGKVEWIDDFGDVIKQKSFPYMDVFNVKNRTRYEWLNHFFDRGNCLCHPCSLVRRECYAEVGMLNPAFANIPDFDLWVRICLRYEIHILDQKLIRFRRLIAEKNASGDTDKGRIRNRYEYRQVLNNFLKITDPSEFLLVFPDSIRYSPVTTEVIPFILGRMAIDTGIDLWVLWGLDMIFNTLQNENTAKLLEQNYHFCYRDFLELSGKCDPFRIAAFFPSSSQPVPQPPPLVVEQGPVKAIYSATRRYAKEVYNIIVEALSK